MFDLGFSEVVVIGAVALVVLGPERLPVVARTAGKFFSKAQSMVSQVKEDIERETELSELKEIERQAKSIAEDVSRTVKGEVNTIRGEVESIKNDMNALGQDIQAQTREITGKMSASQDQLSNADSWDETVSTVETKLFEKRYKFGPSVEELTEEIERLREELGQRSPQLGASNRRLAARARVNRVRIYR